MYGKTDYLNADGSKNEDYCRYCYEKGKFKGDMTREEMIEFCIPHMVKANPNTTEQEARESMQRFFYNIEKMAIIAKW